MRHMTIAALLAFASASLAQAGFNFKDLGRKLRDRTAQQQQQQAAATPAAQPAEDPLGQKVFERMMRFNRTPLHTMPIEEQREYGEAISASMVNALGSKLCDPSTHGALWNYVNLIAAVVAPATVQPDFPFWRVGIIEHDVPTAFSAPGGYIWLTTGLLKFCTSEAQLAGIIAHEMAHVERRHGLFVIKRANDEAAKGSVIGFAVGKAAKFDPAKTANLLGNALKRSMEFNFGKDKEFEADALAAEWIYRVGYNPMQFAETVARIPTDESNRGYRNHPASADRAQAVRKQILANLAGWETMSSNKDRFLKIMQASGLASD